MKFMDIFKSAEAEKIEEIFKQLEPLTSKIREEEAVKTLATRKAAAEKIEILKKEQVGIFPKQVEIDNLTAKLAVLNDERQTVQATINEKQALLMRELLDVKTDISEQVRFLCSTYDPRIDQEIQFYQDHREKLLLKKPDIQTREGERNILTETQALVIFSNVRLIQEGLKYDLEALHELESMKLLPVLDMERVETLRRGIPDVCSLQEFRGEKKLFPAIWVSPPRKTDSQLDWELGKLKEKYKKITGDPFWF